MLIIAVYVSQLTTPLATPYMSPGDLSPRPLSDTYWNIDDGLPWVSQSAGVGTRGLRHVISGHVSNGSAPAYSPYREFPR